MRGQPATQLTQLVEDMEGETMEKDGGRAMRYVATVRPAMATYVQTVEVISLDTKEELRVMNRMSSSGAQPADSSSTRVIFQVEKRRQPEVRSRVKKASVRQNEVQRTRW
ncbi:hypothetical protein PR002_g19610 [Phytophthora rubi]|nr:hypothetical protein PR002_g19610 [Phytophthora rubi]